jgi:hypothetical protein
VAETPSSKSVDLLPTNLNGVRLFPPLPSNFNPFTASPEELNRNGIILPRPDKSDSQLLAKWARMIGYHPQRASQPDRDWSYLSEQGLLLKPQKGLTHQLRNPRKLDGGYFAASNWNGWVVTGSWQAASALITVPTVTPGPYQILDNALSASVWVGLDGFKSNSNDVLQAGISASFDPYFEPGITTYRAWFEWYIDGYQNLYEQFPYVFQTDLPIPVNAGDVIFVMVFYGQGAMANKGCIWFQNVSRSSTSPPFFLVLSPPTGASANGSSVEWIVEANSPPPAALPNVGSVFFNESSATPNAGSPMPWPSAGSISPGTIVSIPTAGQTDPPDAFLFETITIVNGYQIDVIWLPPASF